MKCGASYALDRRRAGHSPPASDLRTLEKEIRNQSMKSITEISKPKRAVAENGIGRLFFLEASGGRIHSVNADGSDRKVIVTGCRIPDGVAVDVTAGHIYWTNMGIRDKNDRREKVRTTPGRVASFARRSTSPRARRRLLAPFARSWTRAAQVNPSGFGFCEVFGFGTLRKM